MVTTCIDAAVHEDSIWPVFRSTDPPPSAGSADKTEKEPSTAEKVETDKMKRSNALSGAQLLIRENVH